MESLPDTRDLEGSDLSDFIARGNVPPDDAVSKEPREDGKDSRCFSEL